MRPRPDTGRARAAPSPDASPRGLRDRVAGLLAEAVAFVAADRVQATARGWLARAEAGRGGTPDDALLVADALALATDLALFTPSASGATAFDRLARRRGRLGPGEAAALDALRQARFRVLRIEAINQDGAVRVRDLASDEVLRVLDEGVPPEAAGLAVAGRLAPLGGGHHAFAGGVMPLDDAGLAVAQGFFRPGGRGIVNAHRCAEAVCRHLLRHGTPRVPGLNAPPEAAGDDGAFPFGPDESVLDAIAHRWAEAGASREPADEQRVRAQADPGCILDMLVSAAMARSFGREALADAYEAVVLIQLETVRRHEQAGSGTLSLDAVAAALDAAIAAGEVPPQVRDLFAALRRGLGTAPSGNGTREDPALERLIGRIRALRAKTVEQGCTEQEALAAAEKVAELLDRHGLSLGELELRRQACEGVGVDTGRRRLGPIDDCVPAIAAFFDCRAWGERDPSGTLRHVFFGLPADVQAARYLHDLVAQAFETESERFRAGAVYAATHARARRTATNSFQVGLARGIVAKLHDLRQAREAALRTSSGRDLIPTKHAIVEEELARLGLHLRARGRAAGRRVLAEAFEAGREAGQRFDYRPGLEGPRR